MHRLILLLIAIVGLVRPVQAAADLARRTWVVDGVPRAALVYLPAGAARGGAPVVFAFHGHGGSMAQAARNFHLHEAWPEAIVVYPQGLPTKGQLTDPSGRRAGWQGRAGDEGDRDLKFFDAMLASLRADYHVDERRIYSTGHSNGGGFTYLLWAERGDVLAAVAPSAALLGRDFGALKPKPVLHFASPSDPLVKFAWQERMLDYVLKLNGCGPFRATATGYTGYPSTRGCDVAVFLHGGGHRYPPEAPALIAQFFRAHTRP